MAFESGNGFAACFLHPVPATPAMSVNNAIVLINFFDLAEKELKEKLLLLPVEQNLTAG